MNVDETLELLRAANPVPAEDAVGQPHATTESYLAALEQRRDATARIDHIGKQPWSMRRTRWRMVAIAAAAALLVAALGYGLINLAAPGSDVIEGSGGIDLSDPVSVLPGRWESSYGTFSFTADLTYSVTGDTGVKETGTYRVIGTLVTLVSDPNSAECAGSTDTLTIAIESADVITVAWEAVGCEAHFVLDCFAPGGGSPGCGRFDRVGD